MRSNSYPLLNTSLFIRATLITSFLLITALHVLASALTMLLLNRIFNTNFFGSAAGGDPLLWVLF
jgi:cytochrome c oxidase subunit 1